MCPPALLSPSRLPGAVFDRQATIRRSLINTDTVSRRPKKVKRRKTISGLPENFNLELGMDHCGVIHCPLLSTVLYQHSERASLLLSSLPMTILSCSHQHNCILTGQLTVLFIIVKETMVDSRPQCWIKALQLFSLFPLSVSSFFLLHPV